MVDMNDPEVIESLKYLIVPKEEKIKTSARPFDSRKNFFVPHKTEGFLTSEITSEDGDNVTVMTSEGNSVTVARDKLLPMNPPKYEKCDDMADLTYLNDATVYHNLRERYVNWFIYTYSGLFCVTINPFKRLPLYTMKMVSFYRGKKKNEVPPHLYVVADNAFAAMCRDRKNQSMLITGESGAGKTENTKKVIQYFAFVTAGTGKKKVEEDPNKPSLEDQIVSANPVLEAYGNAKTTRNNNSSRFGKFIRIHFTQNIQIAGADIESYLLEKSRITYCMELERNYHIFYQLCSGEFPEINKEIMLEADPSKYFYINQGMLTIDRVDDKAEMRDTKKAFDTLMFSQEEQMDLFKLTSAVANWGNAQWKQRPREEQAEPDGTTELEIVAKLMGIDENDLIKGITKPRIKVGSEYVNKGQNKDQCTNSVSALSKAAFSRAFAWLVDMANKTLDVKELKRQHFIGVLDIAGFETFEYNGFEQLAINFTNERLQQFFNNFMFVLEQEEYKKEGIVWETQSFGADLQATIDLIGAKMGLFQMLEEECIVPKATDMTYKEKLYKQHLGKHQSFGKPKPKKGARFEAHFDLTHYAGVVSYSVDGWLEKNKDPINMTVAALFRDSKGNNLLAYLFREIGKEEGGGGKKGKSGSANTISSAHREQLNKLMATLDATSPHFVRCIIPNELKTGGVLDAHLVMHQLHCNGVLEGIRICRKGFPSRLLFSEFLARYGVLSAEACKTHSSDAKKAAAAVLEHVKLDTEVYRIGLTKVLFKAGILGTLEEYRDEIIVRIMTLLQSQMRRFLVKKNIKKMLEQKKALTMIQRNVKSYIELKDWHWFKLMGNIKPLLQAAQKAEEARKAKEAEERERQRQEREAALAASSNNKELEMKISELQSQCDDYQIQIQYMENKVSNEEAKSAMLQQRKDKLEKEFTQFKMDTEDKVNGLKKDIRGLEDKNARTEGLLRDEEDKSRRLGEEKKAVQATLADTEDNLRRETREREHLEDVKRKLEDNLVDANDHIAKCEHLIKKLESTIQRKENEYNSILSELNEEKSHVANIKERFDLLNNRLNEAEADLDEANKSHKAKFSELRKKHDDSVFEMSQQIEKLLKTINKLESEKVKLIMNNTRDQRESRARSRMLE